MNYVPFNLNDYVKVRLLPRGHEILRERYAWLVENGYVGPYRKPDLDKDGFATFQGWELFELFGKDVGMVRTPPFELDVLIRLNEKERGE